MIKVGAGEGARQVTYRLVASEQEEVARISHRFELTLAHIIESPRFLESGRTSLFRVAHALLDIGCQRLLPVLRSSFVVGSELKFAVLSLNFNLKLGRVLGIGIQVHLEMVKVDDSVREGLFFRFLV